MTDQLNILAIEAAVKARLQAYAPYSNFQVGAAIIDEHDALHIGCNVENAAYPEGTCAEAGAIAQMVMAGGRRIKALVVAGAGDEACTPCGGCRQKIREFGAPNLPVTIVNDAGEVLLAITLADLLPHAFGPDNLS